MASAYHLILLAASRVQLCGDIETVLAEHQVLVGPRKDTTAIEKAHTLVQAVHTARQSTLLIRLGGPVIDPAFEAADIGLEELVLGYMGQDAAPAFAPLTTVGAGNDLACLAPAGVRRRRRARRVRRPAAVHRPADGVAVSFRPHLAHREPRLRQPRANADPGHPGAVHPGDAHLGRAVPAGGVLGRAAGGTATTFNITRPVTPPGSYWQLANGAIGPGGQVYLHRGLAGNGVPLPAIPPACQGFFTGKLNPRGMISCVSAHGIRGFITYQPASRYGAFQGIETGIFVVLAAALIGVTAIVVTRRDV
jgi:hypothetical protein